MNSFIRYWTQGPVPLVPRLSPAAPAPGVDQPGLAAGRLPRFSSWFGHSHFRTRQPDPGTDALAYQALGLVEYSPIGAGDHNRMQLVPTSGVGTLFAGRALSAQGLGGLVAGQVISQPLIVPQQLLSEDLGAFDPNWVGLP